MNVTIRQARKEEAPQIAELFLLAWPVDEILNSIGIQWNSMKSNPVTYGHKVAGLIVDVDKPQVEALYSRLGFTYLDDKDFFGHAMRHRVKHLAK